MNLSEIIISYLAFSSGTPVFNKFFSGLAEEHEVSSFYLLRLGSEISVWLFKNFLIGEIIGL
jgi:hypothetical protein